MTRERFTEILEEYEFTPLQIDLLWNSKPEGNLDEAKLRKAAKQISPVKDTLLQA